MSVEYWQTYLDNILQNDSALNSFYMSTRLLSSISFWSSFTCLFVSLAACPSCTAFCNVNSGSLRRRSRIRLSLIPHIIMSRISESRSVSNSQSALRFFLFSYELIKRLSISLLTCKKIMSHESNVLSWTTVILKFLDYEIIVLGNRDPVFTVNYISFDNCFALFDLYDLL